MNSQQARRAGRPFANGMQQSKSLLNNLRFIQHFAAQGRAGGTQFLRLFHHKLRRAAVGRHIRQTSRCDHAVGDGLLLAEGRLQLRLLFRQAEGSDAGKTQRFVRLLQLQVTEPVRLIKEKTQYLRQHHIVNIRHVQHEFGAGGGGKQRSQSGKQPFGQGVMPERVRQQGDAGKRRAAKARVGDGALLAHFSDKSVFR